MEWLRKGIFTIVPESIATLASWDGFEDRVCGSK